MLPDRVDAAIFDLDGTLVDSEPNYRAVDEVFLAGKGVELTEAEWAAAIGMGGVPFMDLLRERHGVAGSSDELVAEKDRLYLDYAVGRTRPFPRVLELVRFLYTASISLAVGTNSRRSVMDAVLADARLDHYFCATVASDDVPLTKPAPDVFLEAVRRLGVEPSRCVVFEDSRYGVLAAKAAGMRVVALPEPTAPIEETFRSADAVVTGGPAALDVPALIGKLGLFGSEPCRASDERVRRFRTVVYDCARDHHRDMPWRLTRDPYSIMVSECMLQQTQVARVVPRYELFLDRFPTVEALAAAPLQDVLAEWQGLGYNQRGKNLRDAAAAIVDRFGGAFPGSLDLQEQLRLLEQLPGVGPYTAAAIAAFAFGLPVTMIETNIRRVMLHFFFPGEEHVHDRDIRGIVEATLDRSDPRGWYYALMDYGTHLAKLFGNANRRSAHYARQSSFVGSVRQVRGRIIAALSHSGALSIDALERIIGPTDARFQAALESLEADGMIGRDGERVALSD